ncbi:uncharacterized protein LOC123555091 [Mercenaria mercenaria]|uniref:uncharacterized protein LOC123555091 n=1 Tax=Mercenaria mercenaria TaxID=6596 RepID=UPI00234F1EE4|nr:uncharacterized protein LOC123555091 [Mercenaria mercenaria]
MNRRYKVVLGKLSLTVIFLIVIFTFGIQLTRYDKSKTRRVRVYKQFDLHNVNKDVKSTRSFTVNTHHASGKQHSEDNTEIESKTKKEKVENHKPYLHNQLEYIPDVSEAAKSDKVPNLSDNITRKFLKLPNITYQEKVAILTPVRNAERALERFGEQVGKLTYPHELISMFFGEDGSTDNTLEESNITAHRLKTQYKFNAADVVKLNISGGLHGDVNVRHEENVQQNRRAHMALARNRLLRFALRQNKFDFILWVDSDLAELPADLVQQMLFAKSDVVATCCLMRSVGNKFKYDRNSWRETNDSIIKQSNLEPDYLVLEGYSKTLRISLPDLKSEGRVVPLDGVGGCALLIKSKCHRSGLQFPEVVYKHHIETEGLAKMARDMGYSVVGLPFVEVFHE